MGEAPQIATKCTRTNPYAFEPRLLTPSSQALLVLRLGIAAENHAPTVANVLGVSERAAQARLTRKRVRARWIAFRSVRGPDELRAAKLRWWWRTRLRNMGINPHSLDESDPAWRLCWRHPRGWLVREVAAEMRAEHVDDGNFHLAAPENLAELLRRVDERTAADLARDDAAGLVLTSTTSKKRRKAPAKKTP